MKKILLLLFLFITNITAFSQCISGDCVNGYGVYVFPNGDKYEGNWVNDNPQGYGTATFISGDKYVGEYFNGIAQGEGTFSFNDGSEYVGHFKEGQLHGKGTIKLYDGTIKQVIYENGKYIGEVQQNESSSSNNNLNYTKQVLNAYYQHADFANKNGVPLTNESKTSTWQCNKCSSVAHKKEKPWSQFGGKCPSNGAGIHTWETVEKNVHWQCNKCGSVAYKKEEPWSQFGGKCPNNGAGSHTWIRAK